MQLVVGHVIFSVQQLINHKHVLKEFSLQRSRVRNGMERYASELRDIPEDDRSEEEQSMLELKDMISEGHFSDECVKVDLLTAASEQNGRLTIKGKRAMRCQEEDCWVLIAEERAGGHIDDAGMHDLWMLCARALVKVQWLSVHTQMRKELKLIIGDGQLLSIVDTKFGNTRYNEGYFESEEGSTAKKVQVIPSLMRPDLSGGAAGTKSDMVTPLRCAVCTCVEMTLPAIHDVLYIPCLKICKHG
jgi:hypothetical protein